MSRLMSGGQWALLASTEWPGVEPPDVEAGDRDTLMAAFPAFAAQIREFMGAGAGAIPRQGV